MNFKVIVCVGIFSGSLNSKQEGPTVTDGYFTNNIHVEVYARTWTPIEKPVANLVFVHGHAEHVNRYNNVFSEFTKSGIKVHAFDQVGCGKTGKRANDLGGPLGVERVRQDIDDAIDRIHDAEIPLFLMGHSFGGLSIIDYLARGNKRGLLYGAIASAPDLELAPESMPDNKTIKQIQEIANRDPKFKVTPKLGKPNLHQLTFKDIAYFSRNKTEVEIYKNDPFLFSECAAIQVRDTITGGRYILNGGYKKITVPRFLISHGTADKITSYKASEKLTLKLIKQKAPRIVKFQSYPGAYHELHTDLVKDKVIANYINWITSELQTTK
ncbi:hypothetical protein DSO57_1017210 [Entomophthora muscae]|uniref:Uncharacterized protein n=1 Tax=Entomophthora muscae TaxID=34485 RepID=A0ACC2T4K3_9FUNG|nr:hypothetical protein DSO57_1017210 [Entomophthora muscae]